MGNVRGSIEGTNHGGANHRMLVDGSSGFGPERLTENHDTHAGREAQFHAGTEDRLDIMLADGTRQVTRK